jgi:hypothetical protein
MLPYLSIIFPNAGVNQFLGEQSKVLGGNEEERSGKPGANKNW